MLVKAGHPWSSIKEYTLAEIGAFLVAISKASRRERADTLLTNWMGSNLTKEGLDEMLSELEATDRKTAESIKQQKVNNEWKRLAGFVKREMR